MLCETTKAPIPTAFYIAKIHVGLDRSLTPMGPRPVSLGICFPNSCTSKDITILLQESSNPPDPTYTVHVSEVRPVPGPYSVWADSKFHIIVVVLLVMGVLMIVGTIMEVLLKRNIKELTRVQNENQNNNVKIGTRITFHKLDSPPPHEDTYQRLGWVKRVMLCFSVITNGNKILNCGDASNETLMCIHGLRFYSLAWVIMAHTYLQIFVVAGNKGRKLVAEKNFMFQTVSNATFSVDTFFFISGLLVSYVYLKKLAKPKRQVRPLFTDLKEMGSKFVTYIGYRFVRLTPAYLFVLFCAELSMKWIKNNSVFEPTSDDDKTCELYWWRNIFYINSLFPRSEMCMLWSWYLANDTQFYIIGIFFLLLSARFYKTSISSFVLLLISSSVTCAVIAVKYGYLVRIEDRFMLFDELYDKPWTRLGPYLIGIFAGWVLTRPKIRLSKTVTTWGWLTSLTVMVLLVYGVRDAHLGVPGSAAYVSLGHIAWGGALAWIVIACSTDHGGYVNKLLSCPLLHPLGRLTYCAYLIHPIVMRMTSFQMEGALHLSSLLSVILFFGNIVAAFFLSFFISLTFEGPIVRLLKVNTPRTALRPPGTE